MSYCIHCGSADDLSPYTGRCANCAKLKQLAEARALLESAHKDICALTCYPHLSVGHSHGCKNIAKWLKGTK